jgi:hypothetical protein
MRARSDTSPPSGRRGREETYWWSYKKERDSMSKSSDPKKK